MHAAGVDCFDAGLFRISAAEATAMDAQQRLLLEVSYEVIGAAAAPESKPMVGSDQTLLGHVFCVICVREHGSQLHVKCEMVAREKSLWQG